MKKIILILFILPLLFVNTVFTKANDIAFSKNCFYLELLGQGILGSVNYEYRFAPHWSSRVGFTKESIFIPIGLNIDIKGSPVMINYLSGQGSHHLEVGLGIFAAWIKGDDFWGIDLNTDEKFMPLYTATIGFRHQPREGGIVYKIGFTPLFDGNGNGNIWGGLSLGYAF